MAIFLLFFAVYDLSSKKAFGDGTQHLGLSMVLIKLL